jgi:hypothetical protein
VGVQRARQLCRDIAGPVATEQPGPMDDPHAVRTGRRRRQVERLDDIRGAPRRPGSARGGSAPCWSRPLPKVRSRPGNSKYLPLRPQSVPQSCAQRLLLQQFPLSSSPLLGSSAGRRLSDVRFSPRTPNRHRTCS